MLAGLNGVGMMGGDFWGSGRGGSVQMIDKMRNPFANRSCGSVITLWTGDIKEHLISGAKIVAGVELEAH
jgi:hypothetical protein